MAALRRDSVEEQQHTRFKRWERNAQFKALRNREEDGTLLLPCWWRSGTEPKVLQPVQLLALFHGEFAVVRFRGESELGLRLVRDGFSWSRCFPLLLAAYQRGQRVPKPFKTVRRIPPDLVLKALAWPPAAQAEFFSELRKTGMLPNPKKLDAEAVMPWFPWEEARSRFIDFRGTEEETGNVRSIPPKGWNTPGHLSEWSP